MDGGNTTVGAMLGTVVVVTGSEVVLDGGGNSRNDSRGQSLLYLIVFVSK